MAHSRCLAQDKLDSGDYAVCSQWCDAHNSGEHVDGEHHWPACCQYCLRDHAHGRYRLKLGGSLGPTTAAARAPKADKPRGRHAATCSVCMEPGELKHGRCVDREACLTRAPQLDLGLEQ